MAWLRLILLMLIARPLARLLVGADIVGPGKLPIRGPATVAANHNSHVDTLLLLALFPPKALRHVRPAAAADYFLANPVMSWVSRHLIGIVPVERFSAGGGKASDILAPAREALLAGDIVVIFPEGTRGAASDELGPLKTGVARLAAAVLNCPVTPVWIQGAGRVLPKGGIIPTPLTCCVVVGEPLRFSGDAPAFMTTLREALEALKPLAPPLRWQDQPTASPLES
jgi:1-acyl-sn-glycerol-3-phosphate acyltransferase